MRLQDMKRSGDAVARYTLPLADDQGAEDEEGAEAEKEASEKGGRSADRGDRTRRE